MPAKKRRTDTRQSQRERSASDASVRADRGADERPLANPKVQAELLCRHYRPLYAAARRELVKYPTVSARFGASDLVQTTFRRFFERIVLADKPIGNEQAALFKIMWQRLNDRIDREYADRRDSRRESRDVDLDTFRAHECSELSDLADREEYETWRQLLRQAVMELGELDRELVTDYMDKVLDLEARAKELRMKVASLKTRLRRALTRITNILERARSGH